MPLLECRASLPQFLWQLISSETLNMSGLRTDTPKRIFYRTWGLTYSGAFLLLPASCQHIIALKQGAC